MADYLTLNRTNWDERAPAHAASPDYQVHRFAEDPAHLSDIVRFAKRSQRNLPNKSLLGLVAQFRRHIGNDEPRSNRINSDATRTKFFGNRFRQAQ